MKGVARHLMTRFALALLFACGGSETSSAPAHPNTTAGSAATPAPLGDAALADAAPDAAPRADEVWLKGSTHVHAKPSGDSTEPVKDVIDWYESHGYDFIALTDHNKVTETDGPTLGAVAVRASKTGLIVLAGVELTHNPSGCLPPGDDTGRCRIHVNALGVTERPEGKLEWANRSSKERVDLYQAALDAGSRLGAKVVQINHPQYYWGMTPEVLTEIGKRGAKLVEVANVQFPKWNAGDATHLSTEALWDAALVAGVTMWGIASDDAHDYAPGGGKYPPGGGWVVVRARRDPNAILDALAAGRFYSSTGVELARAEVDGEELVVEVSAAKPSKHTIAFIENGKVVDTVSGLAARRVVPRSGYLRAVITRDDGKQAWVQPARR